MAKNSLAMFSLVVIGIYILLAILATAGFIASDFAETRNHLSYQPPSFDFWFGTDIFGRSVLSRAIHGIVTALAIGCLSSLIAAIIGASLGAIAGYCGGRVDDVIMWLYTTIESIPYILLLSAFAFALGPGISNVYLALGLTGWVQLCRLVRGEFIKHKEREYVQAAHALGANHSRRILQHIFPNVLHIAIVQFGLRFVQAIKIEVILSFLGLGVSPGTPSWGVMIDDAKVELARGVWWNLLAASLFMFFLILAVNLLNDGLRDALDPKLKGRT